MGATTACGSVGEADDPSSDESPPLPPPPPRPFFLTAADPGVGRDVDDAAAGFGLDGTGAVTLNSTPGWTFCLCRARTSLRGREGIACQLRWKQGKGARMRGSACPTWRRLAALARSLARYLQSWPLPYERGSDVEREREMKETKRTHERENCFEHSVQANGFESWCFLSCRRRYSRRE